MSVRKASWSSAVIVLLLGCAITWTFVLRPASLGGPATYVIVAGRSMQPTLINGDMAVTRVRAQYEIGDVVAFRVKQGIVIHRIVSGTKTVGFTTRGDHNENNDPWAVESADIVGRLWLHVPKGGSFLVNLMASLRQPLYLAALGITLVALFLSGGAGSGKHRQTRLEIMKHRQRYFHIAE